MITPFSIVSWIRRWEQEYQIPNELSTARPGVVGVKIQCTYHINIVHFLVREPPMCWLSYCGGCVLLWCWKICHWYWCWSPRVDRFQWSLQTLQTKKKDLAAYFWKNGHENPVNNSGALFDIEPEGGRIVWKDWTGFCSAVNKVTGVRVDWQH